MQEIRVWSLAQEDPLEKEMATHSSIRAWRISWTEELEIQTSLKDFVQSLQEKGTYWLSKSLYYRPHTLAHGLRNEAVSGNN